MQTCTKQQRTTIKQKKPASTSAGGTGLSPATGASAAASAAGKAATKMSGEIATGTSAITKDAQRRKLGKNTKKGL